MIVWADEITAFAGEIQAIGGLMDGDGGFAEVSGKQDLAFLGQVDLSAANGEQGLLLLDPENIIIQAAGADDGELADNQILFGDGGAVDFTVSAATINAIAADVRQRIGGDEQRVDAIHTRYDAVTFKHLLLPTWLLAYRFHDKPYQVMVNAGTGEVQGERPYSWVKIVLAVASAIAVIGLILFFANR